MAQSLARLWTHLIFSTKDRFPFLTERFFVARCTHISPKCFATRVARHSSLAAFRTTHILCLRFRVLTRSRALSKK